MLQNYQQEGLDVLGIAANTLNRCANLLISGGNYVNGVTGLDIYDL